MMKAIPITFAKTFLTFLLFDLLHMNFKDELLYFIGHHFK